MRQKRAIILLENVENCMVIFIATAMHPVHIPRTNAALQIMLTHADEC
jgi:hypothetical protein